MCFKFIPAGLLLVSSAVWANDFSGSTINDNEPLIANIETIEVPTPDEVVEFFQNAPKHPMMKKKASLPEWTTSLPDLIAAIKNGDIILDQVINIGTKIWQLIEKGKPTVHVGFPYAHAMPAGIQSPMQLEGFSDLNYTSYKTTYQNPFGTKVFDLVYTTVHQYGGSVAENGQYLGNVTILPSKVSVAWGYDVSVDVREVGTSNMGSAASPVAGLLLEIKSQVKTVLKEEVTHEVFSFRGDSSRVTSSGSY